ncbi:hypothetical protein FOA52_014143 [Chlamydomonas sp. UWO 241]|nr:hypothetical protein FOA52_014143 [Chlamydomonas sp. UWO 241]
MPSMCETTGEHQAAYEAYHAQQAAQAQAQQEALAHGAEGSAVAEYQLQQAMYEAYFAQQADQTQAQQQSLVQEQRGALPRLRGGGGPVYMARYSSIRG